MAGNSELQRFPGETFTESRWCSQLSVLMTQAQQGQPFKWRLRVVAVTSGFLEGTSCGTY
jgi:hypothetical protein